MIIALPGLAGLGWPELTIIVLVVLLLFGGKKLPEMARGTGRALRIFKAETKGLMDDDDDDVPATGSTAAQITQQGPVAPPTAPYQQPAAPYQQPAAPYQQPATPYQQPAAPYQQPAAPYQQPAAPYQQPAPYEQQPAPQAPVQAWPQQDPAVVTQPLQPPADQPRVDPQH